MPTPFGDLLGRWIQERGFESAHGYAVKAGIPPTHIYKILDGVRPPPGKYIVSMAATLKLKGRDLYVFMLHAALAHVPSQICSSLDRLHREGSMSDQDIVAGLAAALGVVVPNPPFQRRRRKRRKE